MKNKCHIGQKTLRKGEIACNKQFLLFPKCFPQLYIFSALKCGIVGNGLMNKDLFRMDLHLPEAFCIIGIFNTSQTITASSLHSFPVQNQYPKNALGRIFFSSVLNLFPNNKFQTLPN